MTIPYTQHARKGVLLAGASLIALAIGSADLSAADLKPKVVKARPAVVVKDKWIWWAQGGYTARPAGDPLIGLPIAPLGSFNPGPGWEAAIGFDYLPGTWSPYHISGQFRYGVNNRSSGFGSGPIPVTLVTFGGGTTPAVLVATGTDSIKEDHWLVDFAIGRDFALGTGNVQGKFGVRVAEITSNTLASGAIAGCSPSLITCFTPVAGGFSFQSRSRFLGVGPRAGIDGSVPLGGSWVFDYLGGVAVLFGQRSLNASEVISVHSTGTVFVPLTGALSNSSDVAVFNLDAQAGFSYWFTTNFKLTASYRFDGYWEALTIVEPNGALGHQSRYYYGPMLIATVTF